MLDATPKVPVTVTLGCDPQVTVTLTETPTGTIFVSIAPTDPAMPVGDIDGIFFNLTDDSTLDTVNFFPEPNTGSIFAPVTGVQAAADAVNTLSNGAQTADSYDIGIQFGTVDDSTQGVVPQTAFTLFADNGPLLLEDLDLDSLATVVNSDGGNGQVLTTGDTPDDDPVLVVKEILFEDFDDIHRATDSDAIESNTGWAVAWDKLVTNGHNDGTVTFEEVETDGPVTLTMDLNTHDTHKFENSGAYADSLRVEVSIDGGEWVLLDEYEVNDAGTAIVGSETGQSFGNSGNTVSYSGGILDTAEDNVQFRVVSDISAGDEYIKIDNVSITATEAEAVPGETELVQSEVLADDFNDIYRATDSDVVESNTGWAAAWDKLVTNGHNDGTLTFEEVATDGPVSLTMDLNTHDTHKFENSGAYADSLRVEVSIDGGDWVLLDEYQVNDAGTAIVGSETGQTFGNSGSTVNYSGGILDTAEESAQFRVVSDISAGDEYIKIDNVSIEASTEVAVEGSDGDAVKVDFEGLSSGDVVDAQFAGVSISAQRAGDADNSENDAMIFDSNAPTGGDHDLAFDNQDNILIISEDNDSSDADDNAHGGTITFDFDDPSDVVSITMLDIEESGGTIDLIDANGDLIRTVDIPVTGDGEAQDVDIDTAGVSTMNVNMVGSGAVDDLCYIPMSDDADDECGGQYDVGYIAGIPVLQPIDEDQLKDLDAAEDDLEADALM